MSERNGYRRTYTLPKETPAEDKRGQPLTQSEVATLTAYSHGFTRTEVSRTFAIHANTVKYREKCIRLKLDCLADAEMGRVAWAAMEAGLIPGPANASMGFAVWLAKSLDMGDPITRLIAKRVIEAAAEYDRLSKEGAA